jgi:cytoskeleton protein RodZ
MSPAKERIEVAPIAPRLGADLRAARERVGWSLDDLARALRMRPAHLEALEAGRTSELPGGAYTLGFLRSYATILGLDANEVARRFKAETSRENADPELTFPVPVPDRRVPAGAVMLVGILLVVGTYAGWYHLSGEGRLPAEASIEVPTRLAPLAEQVERPQAPPTPPVTAQAPAEVPPAQQAEAAPPVPAISPGSAAAAVPTPPAASDQPRIVLRASADAWLQVRDKSGQVLLSRTLHAGETWDVPPRPNLLLTTGNAGGTDLLVDGIASGPLGGNGAVRRDLPLDPDEIKDGRLLATGPHQGPQ